MTLPLLRSTFFTYSKTTEMTFVFRRCHPLGAYDINNFAKLTCLYLLKLTQICGFKTSKSAFFKYFLSLKVWISQLEVVPFRTQPILCSSKGMRIMAEERAKRAGKNYFSASE